VIRAAKGGMGRRPDGASNGIKSLPQSSYVIVITQYTNHVPGTTGRRGDRFGHFGPTLPAYIVIQCVTPSGGSTNEDRMSWLIAVIAGWAALNLVALAMLIRLGPRGRAVPKQDQSAGSFMSHPSWGALRTGPCGPRGRTGFHLGLLEGNRIGPPRVI
jgi:hypothetical protein